MAVIYRLKVETEKAVQVPSGQVLVQSYEQKHRLDVLIVEFNVFTVKNKDNRSKHLTCSMSTSKHKKMCEI